MTFAEAFAKSQLGANVKLPIAGNVFISVRDADKKHVVTTAEKLYKTWFRNPGHRWYRSVSGGKGVFRSDGSTRCMEGRPHVVDAIKNGEIQPGGQHDPGRSGSG